MIQNLNDGVAAQGFDVVNFFTKKTAQKGKATFGAKYNDATYHFLSEGNKKTFEENPAKYAPEYGGFCSIAMSEGAQANPNPKSFVIQGDKLYFFTRMLFGIIDAKRQWVKDPVEKQKLADNEWLKMNK